MIARMGGVRGRRRSRTVEPTGRCRIPAFTLIELLVVLAIVMILISLVLGGLRGAREAARKTVCLSNQSQMGKATIAYAGVYKDWVPREGTVPINWVTEKQRRARICWPVALRPFMDSGVGNDTEPNDLFENAMYYRDPSRPKDGHRVHYVINSMPMVERGLVDSGGRYDYQRRRGPAPLFRLRFPETTLYLTEFTDDPGERLFNLMQAQLPPLDLEWTQLYDIWDVLHLQPQSFEYRISVNRHGGGSNAVFLDGHAEFLRSAQVQNVDAWDDRDYGIRWEPLPLSTDR